MGRWVYNIKVDGVRVARGYVPKRTDINRFYNKFEPWGSVENERNGKK
jgi:hypothetical protein